MDKILSVAAYPPPTRWHPFPEVHWEEGYFRAVARRADQVVPLMYDTGLRLPKLYQQLMAGWTEEVVAWSAGTQVLLGLPAYDDAGVGYHAPSVENLPNALAGMHAGLSRLTGEGGRLPPHYGGVSIYCEWEMDPAEWQHLAEAFGRGRGP